MSRLQKLTDLQVAVLAAEQARSTTECPGSLPAAGSEALVSPPWHLIHAFDSGGKRYVVASQPELARRRLSDREMQILQQLVAGTASKAIAYDLGLAESTVRVVLHRVARKLGANTRAVLVERWRELAAAGLP